jgi:hypothetical protein
MDNRTLKNIFKFLEDEGEHKAPLKWKLNNDIPLTKEELNFEGDLSFLAGSSIKSLPKGFKVYGHLDLYGSEIESLPNDLYVEEWLVLAHCKNLTSLPKRLYVGEDLFLNDCTNLESLPEGLQVGRDLIISKTPLAKLSDETILSMIEPDGYINGEILKR